VQFRRRVHEPLDPWWVEVGEFLTLGHGYLRRVENRHTRVLFLTDYLDTSEPVPGFFSAFFRRFCSRRRALPAIKPMSLSPCVCGDMLNADGRWRGIMFSVHSNELINIFGSVSACHLLKSEPYVHVGDPPSQRQA
jgi:hypothetical protein